MLSLSSYFILFHVGALPTVIDAQTNEPIVSQLDAFTSEVCVVYSYICNRHIHTQRWK